MERLNVSSGSDYEAAYGYSRAVRVGDVVHVAGTCARPPHVDGCDAYTQAGSALEIIVAALGEAGADAGDVVRTRIYITDIADADDVLRAHGEVFGEIRPAATLVQVTALIAPALLVEIEADAVIT